MVSLLFHPDTLALAVRAAPAIHRIFDYLQHGVLPSRRLNTRTGHDA
jgi:hypothetical protein